MVSESVESRLLHSSSGFSVPVSCGTIRLGWGAKMAEVTTALCAETQVSFFVSIIRKHVLHRYTRSRIDDQFTHSYLLSPPRSHCDLVAQMWTCSGHDRCSRCTHICPLNRWLWRSSHDWQNINQIRFLYKRLQCKVNIQERSPKFTSENTFERKGLERFF